MCVSDTKPLELSLLEGRVESLRGGRASGPLAQVASDIKSKAK